MSERSLPPVTQVGMLSLALIVASGIYLAAHIPAHVPLAPSIALVSASALALGAIVLALARVEGFAWGSFFWVARWALLAYTVVACMIEYVFLRNHTSGGPLALMTLSLVIFALDVTLLISFTVARYADA
jgi:hypothetical protein